MSGAFAAALVEMVGGLTLAREAYAPAHEEARASRAQAEGLRQELLTLAAADAAALAGFERALALPRGTVAERESRDRQKRTALGEATAIQHDVLAKAAAVAELALAMAERGLESARGDAATGGVLAAGVARSAFWAVRVNVESEPRGSEIRALADAAVGLLARVEEVERKLGPLLARPE